MNVEDLDPSKYYENRSKEVLALKNQDSQLCYPHKFDVKYQLDAFVSAYEEPCAEKGKFLEEQTSVAGRVTNIRVQSKNLIFYDIKGCGVKLQVMANLKLHEGEEDFHTLHGRLRRGDIVGIRGNPGRTKAGELSVQAIEFKLLSPCLYMLPTQQTGLKDKETRYRQRYLDLIMNERSRSIFIKRSQVIKEVKNFLDNYGFLEVETPMMSLQAGGAAAKPFKTHHNDLN